MRSIILIILLVCFGTSYGQNLGPLNQNFWLGYGVSFQPLKKTTINLEAQQRFYLSESDFNENLIEVGLVRKTSKFSKFGVVYRSTWENGSEHRLNRYAGSYKLRIKKNDFEFTNRLGVQFDVRSYTGETKSRVRNKVAVKYKKFKKIQPFVAYDVSYRFDNKNEIDNHRFFAGGKIRIQKNVKLNLFVRFDQEANKKDPKREIIYGSKISLNI